MKKIYRFITSINFYIINYYNFYSNKILFDKFSSLKIRGLIRIFNKGKIVIGNNVKINSSLSSNPIGGQTYTSFVVKKNAELVISDCVGISNSSIVCYKRITIGRDTFIGGDCKIYDTDFHSISFDDRITMGDINIYSKEVNIEAGCFIGGGTTILKGVTIGEKSVIGANSVVTKNIPSNELWAGNPAKFIRKII